jgi:hypothetical protein
MIYNSLPASLLASPELIVTDLVDNALQSLVVALEMRHPALHDPPVGAPTWLRRARNVVLLAKILRNHIDAYAFAAEDAAADPTIDDIPF